MKKNKKEKNITLMKFLKQFYGISGNKTRYMLHKDVINHYDGLEVASMDDENFYENLACGKIIPVIDSRKNVLYYKIERSLLNNIYYEDESTSSFDDILKEVDEFIDLSPEKIRELNYYELINLREKLTKDQRRISGKFDNTLRNIKKELQYRKVHK